MTALQSTSTTRRPILRIDLASISIDDRPNAYKKPQLVLKPQLELAPRRPYTGSRPRMPLWRHFLMVHVKDKADEIVKLDLDTFAPSSADSSAIPRPSVACLFSSCSLLFRHSTGTESLFSTLNITFQKTSDLDTVLRELGTLNINIESDQAGREHGLISGPATFGSWAPPWQNSAPMYRPSSNPRQLNDSSPPLATGPSSHGRPPSYLDSHAYGSLLQRPPSQPIGPPANLQPGQRPWSPAFVPSRPATTLGVPGILGEGIYKVSKIGSTTASRPRVRRTSTLLEQQGPRMYTVSKHFDKTLSKADILDATRGRYLGRGLSSGLQGEPSPYLTRSPSLSTPGTESQGKPGHEQRPRQPLARMSSVLEGVPVNTQHQPRLRRLRTVDDTPDSRQPVGFTDTERQSFLSSVAEEKSRYGFSQPEPASRSIDEAFLFSSSPTLLERPTRHEAEDDWLLPASQIQHQGMCEASRVWDDLMERAGKEVASAEPSRELSEVLSRFEGEFARRWDGVVAATAQNMTEVRVGRYAF
ncbi:hypothetical protein C8A01DRAFT_13289 [Parachaetomium inaequale]|uniref:Uncharacterized protein n=1 Tax=Parachaetomium inaequale TaxID=2588326 RepID=A0AAN6PL94_9PEZI|nr:hypothetical protein C8A01DRAFT_13289 [Parachaetomium inaequale]